MVLGMAVELRLFARQGNLSFGQSAWGTPIRILQSGAFYRKLVNSAAPVTRDFCYFG